MALHGSWARKVAFCAVLGFGLASNAAYACKGANTLLRDDFSDEDPAWGLADQTQGQVKDGAFSVVTELEKIKFFPYLGQNFPAGDACVDIVFPTAPGKFSQAGIGLWSGRVWDFIYIQPDGQAGVAGLQDNFWVYPVPARKADALKTAPGAVNQLRVVWKAPPGENSNISPDATVQVFINDKPFVKFKLPPNANRSVALYADTEGLTYLFKNLNITE